MTTRPASVSYRGPESFERPASVQDAISLHAQLGHDALFLAGGTDVGPQIRRGQRQPSHLISLSQLSELTRLECQNGAVIVGSGVTHREIERTSLLNQSSVALREACRTVGGVQTRNVGTIGGNICNASPAADAPPALLALRASVDIETVDGASTMTLDEFFVGYRTTALDQSGLLLAVHFPLYPVRTGSAFEKLGSRHGMDISIASAAALVGLAEDGVTCEEIGIGLGSVAPTSLRARRAEAVLRSGPIDGDLIEAAAREASDECSPIDDRRASAVYRRQMIVVLVRRALERAVQQARHAMTGAPPT